MEGFRVYLLFIKKEGQNYMSGGQKVRILGRFFSKCLNIWLNENIYISLLKVDLKGNLCYCLKVWSLLDSLYLKS